VNVFDGAPRYPINEIREALGVAEDTPIVDCDARNKDSVKMVLLTLLESLVAKAQARAHMR
jgi:signal recognition particle receptor subunit beta